MFFGLINSAKADFGTELNNVSALGYGRQWRMPGGDVRIPGGFITLLAPLVREIPREYFRYNTRVNEIRWSNNSEDDDEDDEAMNIPKIMVCCNEGERICGDICLITLPLGVLKSRHCMFVPELPDIKLDAIEKLGVGHVNRVYLEYLIPWWSTGECNIRLARDKDDLLNENSSWTRGIGLIKEIPGSKHVISFTLGGQEALEIEQMSSEELAFEFTRCIRKFMNDNSIPYPNNVVSSKWSCDKNYYGARSYIPIGASIGNIKDLYGPGKESEEPLKMPTLLFAGEATHPQYFGTVHGARLSGIREANRIIQYVKLKYDKEQKEMEDERRRKKEQEKACAKKKLKACN